MAENCKLLEAQLVSRFGALSFVELIKYVVEINQITKLH